MEEQNIIVIGASAGGYGPIKKIVAALPKDLNATILIVWHMAADLTGLMAHDLDKLKTIHSVQATDGMVMANNIIYVAVPDHHLVINPPELRVTRGPKENGFRPAIDPLFRSAAYAFGPRVIGIILSGALDDGVSGLWAIKNKGGIVIVQDPDDAETKSMPENAINVVDVDYILPASQIAAKIVELVKRENVGMENKRVIPEENIEVSVAMQDSGVLHDVLQFGEVTMYTCPECHGVLSSIVEGYRKRFRCHTGHAYSIDSLLANLTNRIEQNIWSSIRGVEESIILLNSIGDQYANRNDALKAAVYFKKAKEAKVRMETLRAVVLTHETGSTDSINNSLMKDEVDDVIALKSNTL